MLDLRKIYKIILCFKLDENSIYFYHKLIAFGILEVGFVYFISNALMFKNILVIFEEKNLNISNSKRLNK